MSEDFNYTDNEICQLYKQAKNKKWQIGILKDLTLKSAKQIMEILEEGGCFKMDIEKQEKILEQYDKRLTDKAIGRELGIAQSSVSTFLRGQGLPPNGKKFPNKIEIKEEKEVSKELSTAQEMDGISVQVVPSAVTEETMPEVVQELKAEAEQVIKQRPKLSEYEANLTDEAYLKLAILTLEILKGIWG